MTTRLCSKCGKEKDIEEFPLRNRFTQRRQAHCKDCSLAMGRDWYQRNKDYQKANARKHSTEYRDALREYLHKYLRSHPCEQCGESDPVVLEFHHVGEKDMTISEMITRITSVERLKEELKKTQVLCANCQRKVTAKERGWFRSRK
ncbi:MAG TPA: hypothetical protein VFY83_13605 [Anaerolineales bacterium]|nr:hypothetical protein [Anaerolineales bacterium]